MTSTSRPLEFPVDSFPSRRFTDLKSAYGLACPQCGQARELIIEMVGPASLTAEGIVFITEPNWDASADCECVECEAYGPVSEFVVVLNKG